MLLVPVVLLPVGPGESLTLLVRPRFGLRPAALALFAFDCWFIFPEDREQCLRERGLGGFWRGFVTLLFGAQLVFGPRRWWGFRLSSVAVDACRLVGAPNFAVLS